MAHDWPGNIRELFQTIEQVFAGAVGTPTLFGVHLPEQFRVHMARAGVIKPSHDESASSVPRQLLPWREFKSMMEKNYITRLMNATKGDIQAACLKSGLSRARLYQLIGKYDNNQK
jgi:two-component system NtrC family response regulator